MRNIIGNPAEGDDYFDRPYLIEKLLRDLGNLANILLVAPRRVGKTSLALRLCRVWRGMPRRTAVYLNVEGRSDELAFAEKLIDVLRENGRHPHLMTWAEQAIVKARQTLGGDFKAFGFEASIGSGTDPDQASLGKVLESVFRKIEEGDEEILIAIDELPELLLALRRKEKGQERVAAFLHWLREYRQTYRKKNRWLFLGSIGLDGFVEEQRLQKTINDLQPFSLDAFTKEEADRFLEELATGSPGMRLEAEDRERIVEAVGWPLAYHLQLVFHELLDQTEPRSVDQAIRSLLEPQKLLHFDTWNQRLVDQFTDADVAACRVLLRRLCVAPEGLTREQLLGALMERPNADPDKSEDQSARLLGVLVRDGYLLRSEDRYAFRSFLLREYWRRKFAS